MYEHLLTNMEGFAGHGVTSIKLYGSKPLMYSYIEVTVSFRTFECLVFTILLCL